MRALFIRFSFFAVIAVGILGYFFPWILWSYLLILPMITIGVIDMYQTKQTLRRNFPLFGRMRYFMEFLRPKIYQYFIESDTDGTPFSRLNRNVIYQRAKK